MSYLLVSPCIYLLCIVYILLMYTTLLLFIMAVYLLLYHVCVLKTSKLVFTRSRIITILVNIETVMGESLPSA